MVVDEAAFLARATDEIEALTPNSAIVDMLGDYAVMRDRREDSNDHLRIFFGPRHQNDRCQVALEQVMPTKCSSGDRAERGN